MKLAYFVHDLADPAVAKRVRMLRAAGTVVDLIGFHRGVEAAPIDSQVMDLGRTYDGRFLQRIGQVVGAIFQARSLSKVVADADVIMARNLEMLWLAATWRRSSRPRARLVYECLDVHRLMLSAGLAGWLLRGLERRLMRSVDLLVVSSPAFIRSYFQPRQGLGPRLLIPWLLVENKVLDTGQGRRLPTGPTPHAPWKIGWFGAIRCQRSLDILAELAARRPDLVEVVVRGRPSRTAFHDFDGQANSTPALHFDGAYRPEQLRDLYSEVHFTWAIDYFEEGGNSAWLLPNRIYEGGRYGSVPLAVAGVETGAWLSANGLGVLMNDPAAELERVLETMTPDRYAALAARAREATPALFTADLEACRGLARALAGET